METIKLNKKFPFHVKHFIVPLFVLISATCMSQGTVSMRDIVINYPLPEDAPLKVLLNESPGYRGLDRQEKEVCYYLNYARKNPSVFLERAINVFLTNHPETRSSYTKSLKKTFEGLKPMPIIIPDIALSSVSRSHAVDLSKHNTVSHRSTDGRTFQQRVERYITECAAESIHAAQKFNSLEVVLSLLFDFNVPDLGHRKSLLNPRFHKGGFGVTINQNGNSIAVIDFSCQ